MKYDVFISYSSKDQKVIEALCHYLEEQNIRCFVAYRDIPKGEDWGAHIPPAIKESKVFVYVHTKNSNKSIDTTKEIQYALDYRTVLIPFRLEEIPLITEKEYRLKCTNWMDAFPGKPENYFWKLYNTIIVHFPEKEQTQALTSISESKSHKKLIYIVSLFVLLGMLVIYSNNIIKNNIFRSDYSKYSNLVKKGDSLLNIMKHIEAIDAYSIATEYENKYISTKYYDYFSYNAKNKIESVNNNYGCINGHYYAELGLPSGLKWATCNVGAIYPEDNGNYYAWGYTETSQDTNYTIENYVLWKKHIAYDISGNEYYDVARKKWGTTWRLPTEEEYIELENNCTWDWITLGGKAGYKITGPNGNSIFLPAAGFYDGKFRYWDVSHGSYWSSTSSAKTTYSPGWDNNIIFNTIGDGKGAYSLYFDEYKHKVSGFYRYNGRNIRPVTD